MCWRVVDGAKNVRWGGFFWGGGVFWISGRACGGAEGPEMSGVPGLIEVVFWNGLGLSGIEGGRLVEVVGEGLLGDLVLFRP